MSEQKPTPEMPNTAKKQNETANQLNKQIKEHGGQEGPDPTRYGDWEKGGRCSDF